MTEDKLMRYEGDGVAPAPVLVAALHSPLDAGHSAQLVGQHLINSLPHERIATFDADQLVNYRANRPVMVYEDWRFTDLTMPEIAIDLLRDDEGTPLLLLHGPEPDHRWDSFLGSVLEVVEKYGVTMTVVAHGVPMGVPHTRPIHTILHGTRKDLLGETPEMWGAMQVPAQVSQVLEYRLGEAGRDVVGITAAVPHYLASNPYPAAAAALIRKASQLTDLALPLGELEAAAAAIGVEVAEQVDKQPEVAALVRALEGQFDQMSTEQPQIFAGPTETEVPTADEIGAAAEAFLAEIGPLAESGEESEGAGHADHGSESPADHVSESAAEPEDGNPTEWPGHGPEEPWGSREQTGE